MSLNNKVSDYTLNMRRKILNKKNFKSEQWFLYKLFERNFVLKPYIADFYFSKHKLVVEIDGGVHETQKHYDRKRDWFLRKQYHIQTIRIRYRDDARARDLIKILKKI